MLAFHLPTTVDKEPYFRDAKWLINHPYGSRPLLSRSGCIYLSDANLSGANLVLVPFYRGAVVFTTKRCRFPVGNSVLVPFYRGAVVFEWINPLIELVPVFSSPFIEERLYFSRKKVNIMKLKKFSSPFIEERLYLT